MKTLLNIFYAALLLLFMSNAAAQQLSLPIEWQRSFGGFDYEWMEDIHQTADGGYIVAATTQSYQVPSWPYQGPSIPGHHGAQDLWVLKLNDIGQLNWNLCLGGSNFDQAGKIVQMPDEGFVVCGQSSSNNGNLTVNYGGRDAWLVRLDKFGNMVWQKSVGTIKDEYARDICLAADGNLVFTGTKIISNTNYDNWLVKMSPAGNVLWEKSYGGQGQQEVYDVTVTADGGFILVGYTKSADSVVTGYHTGYDVWLIKTDSLGTIQWQYAYGGAKDEGIWSTVIQTSDGNYVVATSTNSSDGDVSGYHSGLMRDYWLFKISNSGNIVWSKCYGGIGDDFVESVDETSAGALLVTGHSNSADGDKTESKGDIDMWVLKANSSNGQLVWQKTFGGSSSDLGISAEETTDGGYIFGGYAASSDGDLSNNFGAFDLWVLKTGPDCFSPQKPSAIKMTGGTAKVCPGDSRTYTVPVINGVSFNWTAPFGAVITGQGSNSIQVQYTDSFNANGILSVYTSNSCGNSAPESIAIQRNIAPVPSTITGPDYGLCGKHNVVYSVTPVAGYGYHWTMPTIGNITGGQNTNQITANYKPMNFRQTLTVSLVNACGPGPARSKVVRAAPKEPTAIAGDASPCANQTWSYSIAAVNSATSYTWLAPSGAHITANGITSANNILVTPSTSVAITFGPVINSSAYIKVKATNACGDGGYRALYLTPCQLREGDFSSDDLTVYPSPTSGDKITLVLPGEITRELNISVYDISGKELFTSVIASNTHSMDIDISKFYPGIYIIKVYDAVMNRSMRFIKE